MLWRGELPVCKTFQVEAVNPFPAIVHSPQRNFNSPFHVVIMAREKARQTGELIVLAKLKCQLLRSGPDRTPADLIAPLLET